MMRIAVVLPCYNEAAAVARVVEDFRQALPMAEVHVFDNNSSDDTAVLAEAAGAVVHHVSRPGKGNVVRRMFADVDADIYVLADGDATYHAASASRMIATLVGSDLDMVIGIRVHERHEAYRPGHQWGNRMLTGAMRRIFGGSFSDMLSGYRVLSRRFVKSFPATSHGFEIETELTIHAQELRMPCAEVETPYGVRPEGSESKLRTYSDGWRILSTIVRLFAIERPFRFYSYMALALALLALLLAAPLLVTYVETGQVPRLPTAVLATGIALMAGLSFCAGLILQTVTVGRREVRHLSYLAVGTFSRRRRSDD
ncbi:MAG: glycosyltransferase [Rhodocyclaceae bacterium]|nr:glycosyltransferase [Rhodocyclaceae bacterium]